jgi:hypothetical protein
MLDLLFYILLVGVFVNLLLISIRKDNASRGHWKL